MNAIIEWLESPEGEAWSRSTRDRVGYGCGVDAVLLMVKDDEAHTKEQLWVAEGGGMRQALTDMAWQS